MRNQAAACVLILAVLGAVVSTPAFGQGRGRGRGHGNQGVVVAPPASASVVVRFGFAPRDREIITTYFTRQPSGLPPGLAKRQGALPPGLAKQLRRNGTLPPGLRKQLQPFPADLELQLPRLPAGYRRAIVGPHVVVYQPGTYTVVDVVLDIAR